MDFHLFGLLAVLVAILISFDFSKDIPKKPGHPVVLVPGALGSQLQAKLINKPSTPHRLCSQRTDDFYTLWVNPLSMLPISIYCFLDNVRMVFNSSSGLDSDAPGVKVKTEPVGPTESIEWLDTTQLFQPVYATIVDNLVKWGYTRGKDIIGAPYDFRRPPHGQTAYYTSLKSAIEKAFDESDNRKVAIFGYSMGSPVMLYFYHHFVTQAWKDKYIHSHVGLNGAWGGSTEMVKLFTSGYVLDEFKYFVSPYIFRTSQRSFTACAFMLPSAALWDQSEVLVQTAEKNYSLSNLKELFYDMDYPTGWDQYTTCLYPNITTLDAPGVDVHCLYGSGIGTPDRFTWDDGYFPDYQPTPIYGEGDGIVNLRSLKACRRWSPESNLGHKVNVQHLDNVAHLDLLRDQRTLDILYSILYDE
ncbi:hypothetical protein QR680_015504 [Steinernema hermaphroditum]|uniref:Lecithin-cholesterol acyltransferase n=1 Tax=Steinernema hermaphroditum TaxID=289476 RepID=A0AA39LKC0_9BILA|nr:hypothetical protein QR680_015504 [Steinernema hermaphroditum]